MCPQTDVVPGVVDQADVGQFGMLADIGVHGHCAFAAVLARPQILADAVVKALDVLEDGVLHLGRLAHCKAAAQVGPIAAVHRPSVDDVDFPGLDRAIARKTAQFAALVVAVVKNFLTGRKMRCPLRRR